MLNREAVVAVVCESTNERLELVLRDWSSRPIVIRTLSYSPSVGWFTQQEMELTRSEFAGLRNVLGLKVPSACISAVAAATPAKDEDVAVLSFAAARARLA